MKVFKFVGVGVLFSLVSAVQGFAVTSDEAREASNGLYTLNPDSIPFDQSLLSREQFNSIRDLAEGFKIGIIGQIGEREAGDPLRIFGQALMLTVEAPVHYFNLIRLLLSDAQGHLYAHPLPIEGFSEPRSGRPSGTMLGFLETIQQEFVQGKKTVSAILSLPGHHVR